MSSYKSMRSQKQLSPSKNFMYSPFAVETDQKQIIIQKLKEEINLLKKNQRQFEILKEHYKKLDNQYNALHSQKMLVDQQFVKHHQASLRHICQLRNQIDQMKVESRQKNIELQDLKTDQNVLNNELSQKEIQLQKLSNQLNSCIVDSEQLYSQKERLQQIFKNISYEKEKKLEQLRNLKFNNQKIQAKSAQIDKYYGQLIVQEKILKDKIFKYQEQNNQIDIQIGTTIEDYAVLQNSIDQYHQKIQQFQRRIADLTNTNQKNKSQAFHYKKATQSQAMKNNDIIKSIGQAQNTLKVRINQVKQGNKQLEALSQQNLSLNKINSQLQEDLQACMKHLQNLSSLNGVLVDHLHNFSEQDEQVRRIIDRKQKVQKANQKFKQVQFHKRSMFQTRDTFKNQTKFSTRRNY